MTNKQRAYQIKLLQKLHLSPRYINLYKDDRMAYKLWLKEHLRVDSSKELKLDMLIKLVEYFEMKSDVIPANTASSQQISFIRHLWDKHAKNRDDGSLLNFIKRTIKKRLKAIEDLSPKEATQVIAGVKKLKIVSVKSANNPNYKGD